MPKKITYEEILEDYKKKKFKDPEKLARAYMRGLTAGPNGRKKVDLKTKKKLYN